MEGWGWGLKVAEDIVINYASLAFNRRPAITKMTAARRIGYNMEPKGGLTVKKRGSGI